MNWGGRNYGIFVFYQMPHYPFNSRLLSFILVKLKHPSQQKIWILSFTQNESASSDVCNEHHYNEHHYNEILRQCVDEDTHTHITT